MSKNLQSLKQRHELFEKGIISKDEFEEKKREILGLLKIRKF